MALLKNDGIVDDPWTAVDDDRDIGDIENPIVSLARWQRERDALLARNGKIGVRLASDEPPETIARDVHRFGVICLDFPKFTDGRGYSYARLLRTRYGYTGELRAVGNVLRDQALFMRRCGIDAFEVADGQPADGWRRAIRALSIRYQPADDPALDRRGARVVPDPTAPYLESEAGTWSS